MTQVWGPFHEDHTGLKLQVSPIDDRNGNRGLMLHNPQGAQTGVIQFHKFSYQGGPLSWISSLGKMQNT